MLTQKAIRMFYILSNRNVIDIRNNPFSHVTLSERSLQTKSLFSQDGDASFRSA